MSNFPIDELQQRLSVLQDYLKTNGIDIAVFTQSPDIFYYTGSVQPMYLLVSQTKSLVLIRKSFERTLQEIKHIDVKGFYDSKDLLKLLNEASLLPVKKAGFTTDTTSYGTITKLQKLFGNPEIIDIAWPTRQFRMIKSTAELAVYRKAKPIIAKLPSFLRSAFKPGMTELELSAEIEHFYRIHESSNTIKCRKEGIDCIGVCSSGTNALATTKFDGICSGKGLSDAIPYGASNDVISEKTPVIIDFGINVEGYHVDVTRMLSWKKPSDKILKAYYDMVEIEKAVIAELKPGKNWSEVYELSVRMAEKMGYAEEFMGLGLEKVRFVGHGVGLELDEPPFIAPKMDYNITAGMTIAIEPKVSLPGIGVVGIEDTIIVQEKGCELVTDCDSEFIVID